MFALLYSLSIEWGTSSEVRLGQCMMRSSLHLLDYGLDLRTSEMDLTCWLLPYTPLPFIILKPSSPFIQIL